MVPGSTSHNCATTHKWLLCCSEHGVVASPEVALVGNTRGFLLPKMPVDSDLSRVATNLNDLSQTCCRLVHCSIAVSEATGLVAGVGDSNCRPLTNFNDCHELLAKIS